MASAFLGPGASQQPMKDTTPVAAPPSPYTATGKQVDAQPFASKAPGVGTFTGIDAISPYADPAFGAYMRGLGVNEGNLRAEIALRNNRLSQQYDLQQPVFQEQLQNGLKSIGGNYEDRGSFNSGTRISDQTQFAGDVARSQQQFGNDIQSQRDDLQMRLASQLAQDQANAAEKALSAKQNIALLNAQAGLYQ